MRRRLATLLCCLPLVVAGCGDGPPADATAAPGTAAEAAGGEPLTEAEAKAALLTAADLPSGWTDVEEQAQDLSGSQDPGPAR